MYITKVYKYDSSQEENGYRGEDWSRHLLLGSNIKEDITQELDVGEITLAGMTFENAITPETKIIIDKVEIVNNQESIVDTYHFCVEKDIVDQPILSDNNYFDHHISLIEPSVVAQKRLVDNISTTYKLKDVSLQEIPAFPTTTITLNIENSQYVPNEKFGDYVKTDESEGGYIYTETYQVAGKYFELEGDLLVENTRGEIFDDIYSNIDNFETQQGTGVYLANFLIPKLAIFAGKNNTKNFEKIGYASIVCKIEEFNLNDLDNPTNSWTKTFISNSNLGGGTGITTSSSNGWQEKINGEWLIEKCGTKDVLTVTYLQSYYKKYTETSAETPTYRIDNIPIQEDKRYVATISLYQFPDNLPKFSGNATDDEWYKFTGSQPSSYVFNRYIFQVVVGTNYTNTSIFNFPSNVALTSRKTSGSAYFITYGANTGTIVYASSTPYSALALLQKAIINSSIYEKQDGVYIADINNSNIPFYIDDEFRDELSSTLIIENFYNQKNLWEIMIEVGNYIHAIPELKFGSDDRFIITFNRLGRTDELLDSSNKVSIFNSRGVEDYISATSSYIENMVQLGGFIEEWVVPKTTNETYLVSNDTAEIIVSKPIIELLNITVRRNSDGATADLTEYVYEENVYKTLSVDYSINPNRGIALYYSLGDNIIGGGQYRLPQMSANAYNDYTIKKVIYCAFNGYQVSLENPPNWSGIKVSDYSFFVRYRTKDSVRQNHIRPDLRKYLLNSKYDRYPEHNQFNNQTDVVVDSLKFGNNIYGKLIKTGNNSYTKMEWTDNIRHLKHKGELYRINGELYYVATANHFDYNSYYLSEITFSKDYNELSKVVGIPSEPRFYEISEQSLIWREFAINDILLLTDNINQDGEFEQQLEYQSNYVFTFDHLADLMLGTGTDFARYAISVYKGDKDTDTYDQTVGQKDFYIETINPINAYSSENTLTYEWDTIDNYSAGDKVIKVDDYKTADEKAYSSLRAVKYTDIYGKAALFDFYVLGEIQDTQDPTQEQLDKFTNAIMEFPESPIRTKYNIMEEFVGKLTMENFPTNEELDTFVQTKLSRSPQQGDLIFFEHQLTSKKEYFVYIYNLEWVQEPTTYTSEDDFTKPFIGNYEVLATNVKTIDENYNGRGIGLLKDCREALSINFNLQLATNSDTFVLSPYVFLPQKQNVKIVLLANEVNKLSSGYINNAEIITPFDDNGQPIIIASGEIERGTTLSNLIIDETTWKQAISVAGVYRFVYSNAQNSWTLNGELVSLDTYGVSIDGEPINGDIIKVVFQPYFDFEITKTEMDNAWDNTKRVISQFSINISSIFENVSNGHFIGENGYQKIKAIAILCDVSLNTGSGTNSPTIPYKTQFVVARNIPNNWSKERALSTWYFGSPKKDIFKNKQ